MASLRLSGQADMVEMDGIFWCYQCASTCDRDHALVSIPGYNFTSPRHTVVHATRIIVINSRSNLKVEEVG